MAESLLVKAFPNKSIAELKRATGASFGDVDDESVFMEFFRLDLHKLIIGALDLLPNKVTKISLKAIHVTEPYDSTLFPRDAFAEYVNHVDKDQSRFSKDNMLYFQTIIEDYVVQWIQTAQLIREKTSEIFRRKELMTLAKWKKVDKTPLIYMDMQLVKQLMEQSPTLHLLSKAKGSRRSSSR